ncbi:hypothetical protein HPB51_026549 [Rhipicephalus microplus]|uniref:Uncharacterized protein n=1 Tax=Rhipicephalus microplus TaxID=6941 RepID=A0A9J6D2L7_RHIMP|nr:hypothetical protein HPB51_026549 [Rhipicephalus microplus]
MHWTPLPHPPGNQPTWKSRSTASKSLLEKWSDDSWTARQGFAKPRVSPQNPSNSTAATRTVTPSLPRLSPHTYHIVGRAKTPIDLMRTSPGDLQRALLKAASLCDLDPAKHDQIRIHQMNNTFTVSVTKPTEQLRTNASRRSSSKKTSRFSYTCTPRHPTTRYKASLSTPIRSPLMMRRRRTFKKATLNTK